MITAAVSLAFAAKWLLPRLETFQSEHPETDIRQDTRVKPVDFVAQRIDIGLQVDRLLDEVVFPVCSSLLMQKARRP